MTQKDAINMLCNGAVIQVAYHLKITDPKEYCICDSKKVYPQKANRINPEIIAFIINAVNQKIKAET